MYNYLIWPGAYSFKQEITLFLRFFREQIEELEKKIGV
jgi:hypothetical protein